MEVLSGVTAKDVDHPTTRPSPPVGDSWTDSMEGAISPGRQSHSETAPYISSVVLSTKYAGRRQNGFDVRGQARSGWPPITTACASHRP